MSTLMRKFILLIQTLFVILLVTLFQVKSFSQISVPSTTGYQVNLNVYATSINPASNSCTWGYNYTVNLSYNITFSGSNIPASLYTLQGNLGCNPGSLFFDLPNNGGSGTITTVNGWNPNSNCGSATVATLGCGSVSIQIEGPGISSRIISFAPSVSLAVKLVNFSASVEGSKVKINWATASETDNDYFTIERSADGAVWKEIAKVKGAGNSNNFLAYQSYDDNPIKGTSFYRLKQTDIDGKFSYSGIEAVKYSLGNSITVYPVPNSGNTIRLNGAAIYKHDMAVINASGKIVFTTTINQPSVDLPSIPAGIYIIRLTDKTTNEIQNIRYVKI